MKTIVANWKMNVGTRESIALARSVLLVLRGKKVIPSLVVCPPFTALSEVRKIVARSHVALGAQDASWEAQGNFTGEISLRMLAEHGVTHVIVGHSERRRVLGETDEMVGKKFAAVLAGGLTPILCVGETKAEREAGEAEAVVRRQLTSALRAAGTVRKAIWIAYEPVWAIGTGVSAEPADAVKMHSAIRSMIADILPSLKNQVTVLYGGSVDPKNAYAFLREQEVDGVLVGGASVKANQFAEIVQAGVQVMEAQSEV